MQSVNYVSIRDLVGLTIKSSYDQPVTNTLIDRIKSYVAETAKPVSQGRLQEIITDLGSEQLLDDTIAATKHLIDRKDCQE